MGLYEHCLCFYFLLVCGFVYFKHECSLSNTGHYSAMKISEISLKAGVWWQLLSLFSVPTLKMEIDLCARLTNPIFGWLGRQILFPNWNLPWQKNNPRMGCIIVFVQWRQWWGLSTSIFVVMNLWWFCWSCFPNVGRSPAVEQHDLLFGAGQQVTAIVLEKIVQRQRDEIWVCFEHMFFFFCFFAILLFLMYTIFVSFWDDVSILLLSPRLKNFLVLFLVPSTLYQDDVEYTNHSSVAKYHTKPIFEWKKRLGYYIFDISNTLWDDVYWQATILLRWYYVQSTSTSHVGWVMTSITCRHEDESWWGSCCLDITTHWQRHFSSGCIARLREEHQKEPEAQLLIVAKTKTGKEPWQSFTNTVAKRAAGAPS